MFDSSIYVDSPSALCVSITSKTTANSAAPSVYQDGDAALKMIAIELADDDEYEATEHFSVVLSAVAHPNPAEEARVHADKAVATVFNVRVGPNDAKPGTVGFGQHHYYVDEAMDETVYVAYGCAAQTANDGRGSDDNHKNVEWLLPREGLHRAARARRRRLRGRGDRVRNQHALDRLRRPRARQGLHAVYPFLGASLVDTPLVDGAAGRAACGL